MSYWAVYGYGLSAFFTLMAAIRTDQFVREGKKSRAGSVVLYALLSIGLMLFGTAAIIGNAINNS